MRGLHTLNRLPGALPAYLCGLCFVILQFESPKQLDYPCLPCVSPAHALPMFREARQRSTRKQLEKDRLDPKKSHKPEPPVSGPGKVLFFFLFLAFISTKHEFHRINKKRNKKIDKRETSIQSVSLGDETKQKQMRKNKNAQQTLSFEYECSNKGRLQFCSCF